MTYLPSTQIYANIIAFFIINFCHLVTLCVILTYLKLKSLAVNIVFGMKTNLASTLRFIHTKNNFIKLLNFNYYDLLI